MEKAMKSLEFLMRKGIELVALARVRDRARMKKAVEIQDVLRKKSKGFDSTLQVRKGRDARHGPAGA